MTRIRMSSSIVTVSSRMGWPRLSTNRTDRVIKPIIYASTLSAVLQANSRHYCRVRIAADSSSDGIIKTHCSHAWEFSDRGSAEGRGHRGTAHLRTGIPLAAKLPMELADENLSIWIWLSHQAWRVAKWKVARLSGLRKEEGSAVAFSGSAAGMRWDRAPQASRQIEPFSPLSRRTRLNAKPAYVPAPQTRGIRQIPYKEQ
jgi:hypothetical protein